MDATFSREFPFNEQWMKRWKDGVRIWPSRGSIKSKPRADPKLHEDIIQVLLKHGIIKPSTSKRYAANMFVIPKGENSIQPFFNYSQMTPYLKAPKLILTSIYQVVRRKPWARNLWYVKLDFAQAFFNIDIHPKSQMVTTIAVNGKRYEFTRMPFGISIAPFVCKTMLNGIIKWIRERTNFVWGHIDDIIIGCESRRAMQSLVDKLLAKLDKAGWRVNKDKAVLVPTRKIEFLGATWRKNGVKRLPKVTQNLYKLIKAIPHIKGEKQTQRAKGYLQYYLQFMINSARAIELAFKNKAESSKLMALVKFDFIKWKRPKPPSRKELIYSNATISQIGANRGGCWSRQ